MTKKLLLNIVYPFLAVGLMLAVWAIGALAVGESLLLPSPAETARAFARLVGSAGFWSALGGTFLRTLLAYSVCLALALALAAAGTVRAVRKIVAPVMTVARSVPTMAVIFLLILWTGSKRTPVFVTVTVLLPTMYAEFRAALDAADSRLGEMSRVYRVPPLRRLTGLYIPSLVPSLVSSASYLSLGLKLVVAAEALAMTANSLGMMLSIANAAVETARLTAIALAAVIAGFLIEGLAACGKRPLERRGYAFG